MRSMYMPKDLGMDFVEAGIAAVLTSLTLKLYQNDYTPNENITTDAGVFTEATFSGYADDEDFEFEQPYVTEDGQTVDVLHFHQFNYVEPGSDPVSNTVYGYYVVNGDGDVVGAARFDDPKSMNSDSTSCPVTVTLQMLLAGLGI